MIRLLSAKAFRSSSAVYGFSRANSTMVLSDPLVARVPPLPTRSAVTAALQLGGDKVFLLVMGGQLPVQTPNGITCVLHMIGKDYSVENIQAAVEEAVVKYNCTHVVATSPLLPQVAERLSSPVASDVVKIVTRDTFLMGDNASKVSMPDMLKLISIRASSFEPVELTEVVPSVQVMKEDSKAIKLAYKVIPAAILLVLGAMMLPE